MLLQASTNTRSTKPELSARKKAEWRVRIEKMCQLLTTDVLMGLPGLSSEIFEEGMVSCPWHSDDRPSCKHWICDDGYPLWTCFAGCGTKTPLDAVALSLGTCRFDNFRAVWNRALEIVGGPPAIGEVSAGDFAPTYSKKTPKNPPARDVAGVFMAPAPVSASWGATGWLEGRGITPAFVEEQGLAYATPSSYTCPPWMMLGRSSWSLSGFGIMFATVGPDGRRASARARATGCGPNMERPKRKSTAPSGYSCDETILVNPAAWRFFVPRLGEAEREALGALAGIFPWLAGDPGPLPTVLEITEGEPDWLLRCEVAPAGTAVIGIYKGAWSQAFADKIPDGTRVKIYCHSDAAGQGYQHQIAASLRGRCQILVRHPRPVLTNRWVDGKWAKDHKFFDEVELHEKLGRAEYVASSDEETNMRPYLPPEKPATVAGRPVVARAEPRVVEAAAAEVLVAPETPPEAVPAVVETVAAQTVSEATEAQPEAAQVVMEAVAAAPPVPAPPAKRAGRPSVAQRLVELADARGVSVAANDKHEIVAQVPTLGGKFAEVPLNAKKFGPLLIAWLGEAGGAPPSKPTIEQAIATLAARVRAQLIGSEPVTDPAAGEILGFHDADNAVRVERAVAGKSIHAPESGWMTLRLGVWERNPKAIIRLAEAALRKIPDEAALTFDEDLQKQIRTWGQRSLSKPAIEAAISLASAREALSVEEDDLDKDNFLLGVANGVLDIRTKQLVADPTKALVTRRCPVAWANAADCPRWKRFLHQVFDGDQAKIDFLQRFFGYLITGDVRYHVMLFLHGVKARNGKTTILDIILALLGDYAHKAGHQIVSAARAKGTHPTDRDQMRGRRATVIDEWPRNTGFDEEQVKTVTGSRRQTSRDIGKSESNFPATSKIVGASNGGMTISSADNAMWSRIVMLECPVSFLGREDRTLPNDLARELPGILAWAVDGAHAWMRPVTDPVTGETQAAGLQIPAHVQAFTDAAREKLDHLGRWADECLVFEAGAKASPTALSGSWALWCEANKIPAEAGSRLSRDSAGDVFEARWGLTEKRSGPSMVVVGVRVRGLIDPPASRRGAIPTTEDLDSALGDPVGLKLVRP